MERWIQDPPAISRWRIVLNSREQDAAILSLADRERESDDGANLIIAVKRQGPFHYFARFRRSETSENPGSFPAEEDPHCAVVSCQRDNLPYE